MHSKLCPVKINLGGTVLRASIVGVNKKIANCSALLHNGYSRLLYERVKYFGKIIVGLHDTYPDVARTFKKMTIGHEVVPT